MANRRATAFGFWLKSLWGGGIVVVGVLLGLALIHSGATALITISGTDYALPGDNPGDLDIISTRSATLEPQGIAYIMLGVILALGSVYLARYIAKRPESA